MAVETFANASQYKKWVAEKDSKNVKFKIISVVVFNGQLVVTWEYV